MYTSEQVIQMLNPQSIKFLLVQVDHVVRNRVLSRADKQDIQIVVEDMFYEGMEQAVERFNALETHPREVMTSILLAYHRLPGGRVFGYLPRNPRGTI